MNTTTNNEKEKRLAQLSLALAVIFVAAFFRFWALARLPAGLYRDEAYNILDEATITWSNLPVFFPANGGREALFFYWQQIFLVGLGVNTLAVRLASTTIAVAAIALEFTVVRRMYNWRVAAIAAFIFATLYVSVQGSRLGLRYNTVPFVVLLLLLVAWQSLRHPRVATLIIAGVVIGVSVHTYAAARVLPLLGLGIAVYALVSRPLAWRIWCFGSALAAMSFVVIAAPLVLYLRAHPEGELRRLDLMASFGVHAGVWENITSIAGNVVAYALSFSTRGDIQWLTNIPARPIFDPLNALLFWSGIVVLFWLAFRRPAAAKPGIDARPSLERGTCKARDAAFLCLMTLAVMHLPGILSGQAPYFQRVVGALPIVALSPAIALDTIWTWFGAQRRAWMGLVAVVVPLTLQTWLTRHDYFDVWATARNSAFQYCSGATIIASFLKTLDPRSPVHISTDDTQVPEALAPQETQTTDWFHARELLPLPLDTTLPHYYFFDLNDPGLGFAPSLVEERMRPLARSVLTAVDRNTGFEVAHGYLVEPGQTLTALLPDGPQASFAGKLSITGADVRPDQTEPGTFHVLLGIRATHDSPGYLSISVRAVDDLGNIWAQEDSLGANLAFWRRGQQALSVHRLRLYRGTPAGHLHVEARLYELVSKATLPRDDGMGEALDLGVVSVDSPVENTTSPRQPALEQVKMPLGNSIMIDDVHISSHAAKQGDAVRLDLQWSCVKPSPAGTKLAIELANQQAGVVGTFDVHTSLQSPGADACHAGDTYLERRQLPIGPRWVPGAYQARVVIRDPQGAELAGGQLGTIQVEPLARVTTALVPAHDIGATFADGIVLSGVTVTNVSGQHSLNVHLAWKAIAEPARAYTVFVHVLGLNDKLIAQHDGPPSQGVWPTTTWTAGQAVDDPHMLTNIDATTGTSVLLEIGLYDPNTGVRVPILSPGTGETSSEALRLKVTVS